MKTKITLLFLTLTMMAGAFGQKSTFELTFSGVNNATYVQLGSIKILNSASDSHLAGSLEYLGGNNSMPQLKTTEDVQSFFFILGDTLLYIGYANTLQSGMLDSPGTSATFIFQFATNIPCPGTPTVTYEGQVYNTIQIFNQCWLKENLNVGTMINGNQGQTNNNIIEKYCHNNNPDSCTKYGGLYQWNEMMQYETTQGAQGICPPNWHLPTDEEWKVMEGSVDSQYGIGEPEWDVIGYRGYDASTNLRTTNGWTYSVNFNGSDLFGFSALPGGYCFSGNFYDAGNYGYWWSSLESTASALIRNLDYNNPEVNRSRYGKLSGFSVRCLRDN